MIYYRIAGVTLQSEWPLPSFGMFACEPCKADAVLTRTNELPPAGQDIRSGSIIHRKLSDGWFFHTDDLEQQGLYVSEDYSVLRMLGKEDSSVDIWTEWFVRIALECLLARRGYVSLHSAAVEIDGKAVAFTGHSGIGKSTRAAAWIRASGAKLVNGDRPLIHVNEQMLYGVPWDGKEQCFRNVSYPLLAICEVRRSSAVFVREMSFSQRRKLLMRQCFLPMWDTETATVQMANISRLAAGTRIVRAFCGPSDHDAKALYDMIQHNITFKEETDMKAKPEFVLRHVVDEYILMPTGDNISKFNGTILLNEVSALVWEKLQNPISKEDLLNAVLEEYEVEKAAASEDLDDLLGTLRQYGVIEDD